MHSEANDRRVRKTKKALRQGLAELMISKDIRNITIKELTDKVDIHRSTFYAHFNDIYDLYTQMEDLVIVELEEIITSNFALCFKDYYKILFDFIEENQQMCKLLFSNNSSGGYYNRLRTLFKEACLRYWCELLNLQSTNEELDYYVEYHLEGCFALIRKWASSNFQCPKEKLIKMIENIETNIESQLEKG